MKENVERVVMDEKRLIGGMGEMGGEMRKDYGGEEVVVMGVEEGGE